MSGPPPDPEAALAEPAPPDPEAPLPEEARSLLERFREGKRLGLARAISFVEDERPGFQAFLHRALEPGPRARRTGITGPPGAGKSSLVASLATTVRERGEEVGVVAVDPTSPYSGGALLGDRIRMNDLATDPGIFIRSMATRGSLGGLATTTREIVDLMDAFGFPRVFVETVGVGQSELEIAGAADTIVVVLVPESGDSIQAMKAGLMEIADVFVVNKADRPGADRLVKELRLALHLRHGEALRNVPAHHGVDARRVAAVARGGGASGEESAGEGGSTGGGESARGGESRGDGESAGEGEPSDGGPDGAVGEAAPAPDPWEIPVLKTDARTGEGVEELLETVDRHRRWLEETGGLAVRRRERARVRVRDVVDRELRRRARRMADDEAVEGGLDRIARGEATPYSVAFGILEGLLGERGG